MKPLYPACFAALLCITGCVTLPAGSYSHSRFVNASDERGSNVGFTADGVVDRDTTTIPVVHGALASPLSEAYDASVVVADGLLTYEGLARFGATRRVGVLHGAGFGLIPSVQTDGPDELTANLTATTGFFGQIGPSFYGAATYSILAPIEDGELSHTHFAAAELGYVLGEELRFAPTVRVFTPLWGDPEPDEVPAFSLVLGLSVLAGF